MLAAELGDYEELVETSDDERKQLGERVRAERKKRHWSRERLAIEAKCSATTITRIETGKIPNEPRALPGVLAALGMGEGTLDATEPPLRSTGGMGRPKAKSSVEVFFEQVSDLRDAMVNMAIDRGDPIELVRALRTVDVPKGASVVWWAAFYADLREQHRPPPTR